MGAVGGVCALANIAPQPLLDLIAAYKAGDMDKSTEIQLKMIAPNNVFQSTYWTRITGMLALCLGRVCAHRSFVSMKNVCIAGCNCAIWCARLESGS
jgi:dihydrodipicolinate synthase/N-acetylneuraminate lyase